MPIEYRKDRKKWGCRVFQTPGISDKRYAWDTGTEAKQAKAEFLTAFKKNPHKTTFQVFPRNFG